MRTIRFDLHSVLVVAITIAAWAAVVGHSQLALAQSEEASSEDADVSAASPLDPSSRTVGQVVRSAILTAVGALESASSAQGEPAADAAHGDAFMEAVPSYASGGGGEPAPAAEDGPVIDLPDDLGGALDRETGPEIELPPDGVAATPEADRSATLTERLSGIVDKTVIGGYGEYEYHAPQGEDSFFQHHRYILFVFSQISERISTSTEIEFEFGGSPRKSGGSLGFGEVLLEFSVVDFKVVDALILRAGIILVPVSSFNIKHDSPTRDLTERPIGYTTVVPSTWFESGAGALGELELGSHRLTYEAYVINGLDAKLDHDLGLRGARGSLGEDNNDDKAFVGRVAWHPSLGVELGLSGYTGEYNKRDDRVNIVNLDFFMREGAFELLFEGVRVFVDPGFVEGFAVADVNTREAVPEGMSSFFIQANYHFSIPALWDLFPEDMKDATFTAVARYEEVDTSVDDATRGDKQRLTLGLNFRPVEAFVLKTDYQLGWSGPHGLMAWVHDAVGGGGVYQDDFALTTKPTFTFVASAAMLF